MIIINELILWIFLRSTWYISQIMTSYAYDGKDFFEIYFDKMLLFTKNTGISYTYVLGMKTIF